MSDSNSNLSVLTFAGVMALLMSFYRIGVLIVYGFVTEFSVAFNNLSEVAVLWALAGWCLMYARFHKWGMNLPGEVSTMRFLSYLAGLLCWVRAVSSALYFAPRLVEEDSYVTPIYVGASILLWLALGAFLFGYARRNRNSSSF